MTGLWRCVLPIGRNLLAYLIDSRPRVPFPPMNEFIVQRNWFSGCAGTLLSMYLSLQLLTQVS